MSHGRSAKKLNGLKLNMNQTKTRWLVPALIAIWAVAHVGCASVRPLKSRPVNETITLREPSVIPGPLQETVLPAGLYRAMMEDRGGLYYEAPAKIISNGTRTITFDGGVYVPREAEGPTHYYAIGRNH